MDELLKAVFKNPLFLKYQAFILPGFSLAACFILLVLIILPNIDGLINSRKTLVETRQKIDLYNTKAQSLESVDTTLYKEYIKTSLLAIPMEQDIPGAVNQVKFLVSSSKLKLESIALGGVSSDRGKSGSLQVSISVSGDLSALKNFISKARELPRLMKITNFEFTASQDGRVQASLSLVAFHQPLITSIGSLDQPVSLISKTDTEILSKINTYKSSMPSLSAPLVNVPKGKSNPFE